jgi:V-type H+-transporting ATPase subunit a
MSLGICMKGFNAVHFRSIVDFVFEFIPQICLLLCLFGWMDVLIIAKWVYTADLDNQTLAMRDTIHNSPAIITTMINIFLNGADNSDGEYYVVPGQKAISLILLLIAFITVPIMLFVKPCYLSKKHSTHHAHGHEQLPSQDLSALDNGHDGLEAKMLNNRNE